jgi:outer membrane lipoprotein SlyB
MSIRRNKATAPAVIASISIVTLVANVTAASAQPYDQGYGQGGYQEQGPPPDYSGEPAPPQGQYAPAPGDSHGGSYDPRLRDYDRDYAGRYSAWAAENCVDRRNTNTVAGAIIGGVLGAVIGSNVAGRGERGEGTVIGGALGATAGGVVGHAAGATGDCPPGYLVRSGAPAFHYGGGYGGSDYSAPSWYHPWVWSGSQWTYHPYREWYYNHPTYWRPSDNAQGSYDQGYAQGSPDQGYVRGPPPDYRSDFGPPQGQYAPAPPGWRYGGSYDYRTRQYDRDYAGRYSAWAAQNCVDRRNTNTVAGAVIGGVLGAVIGSNVAGRGERGEGTVIGGALGATAGGVIGHASTNSADCPPGYVVRRGASAFYYGGSYYAGPSWYRPWVWSGGQWTYHPYREWYYGHPTYWQRSYRRRNYY